MAAVFCSPKNIKDLKFEPVIQTTKSGRILRAFFRPVSEKQYAWTWCFQMFQTVIYLWQAYLQALSVTLIRQRSMTRRLIIECENMWKEVSVAQFEAYPEICKKVRSGTKQAQKSRSRGRDMKPEALPTKPRRTVRWHKELWSLIVSVCTGTLNYCIGSCIWVGHLIQIYKIRECMKMSTQTGRIWNLPIPLPGEQL
jgi:hypothetical protein